MIMIRTIIKITIRYRTYSGSKYSLLCFENVLIKLYLNNTLEATALKRLKRYCYNWDGDIFCKIRVL